MFLPEVRSSNCEESLQSRDAEDYNPSPTFFTNFLAKGRRCLGGAAGESTWIADSPEEGSGVGFRAWDERGAVGVVGRL